MGDTVSGGDAVIEEEMMPETENESIETEGATVSGGDAAPETLPEETAQPIQVTVAAPEAVPFWNSNINEYGVTDGLLLCILLVLLVQTFVKRRG